MTTAVRFERKTHAALALRSPAVAALHLTLLGIRNAHAYPARVAIDAYFDAAAIRARARMGHLAWQLGDETTAGTFAFDAATLVPASEETALAAVLVPLAMAIAEASWLAINASGTTRRAVKSGVNYSADIPGLEVKASPATIDTGDPAWDGTRPSVQAIAAGAQSRAVGITDVTRAALAQTIATGAAQGYSIQQIANGVPADGYAGVHAIIAETYKNRGMAIAQYELGTAQNLASSAQYQAAGIETFEVMDDEGPNSCDQCIDEDGDIVDADYADANPLIHPWCVRAYLPHFPENEPDQAEAETPEPPPSAQGEPVAASTERVASTPTEETQGPLLPDANLPDAAAASVAEPASSSAPAVFVGKDPGDFDADLANIPLNVEALGDGSPPPRPSYWAQLNPTQQGVWTDAEDQATQDFMDTHAAPGDEGFSGLGAAPPKVLGNWVSAYDPSDEEIAAENEASDAWVGGLTPDQRLSLDNWTQGNTSDVRTPQMAGTATDLSRQFDSALEAAPKFEGTVYRGASKLSEAEYGELTPGTTITLRADSSTSKDPTTAFLAMTNSDGSNKVYYVIDQTSGASIESVSRFPGEHEVVALRGGTYTVEGVEHIKRADNPDYMNPDFLVVHLIETMPPAWRKGISRIEHKAAHPNAPVDTRLARFVGEGLAEWEITKPAE
jgi:hypothetical protein